MFDFSRSRLLLPVWLLLLLIAASCSSPADDPAPTSESGASSETNENEDSSETVETDDTAEPVEISFMVFGDPAELAAYQALMVGVYGR